MIQTLFVNLPYLKIYFFDFRLDLFRSDCFKDKFILFNDSYIIIIQINYPLRIFNNRGCIRRNKVFTFSYSDNQWTAFLGSEQSVWLPGAYYDQSICSFNPVEGKRNCPVSYTHLRAHETRHD